MTVRLLHGHVVDQLATLDPESVHCCVTSPPYWGLRDYGTEKVDWPAIAYAPMPGLPACVEVPAMRCSLGLEPTIDAFIGHMVLVFRGVHRALRKDGTAWVNMGDSYAGTRDPKAKHSDVITGRKTGSSAAAAGAMAVSRRRDRVEIPRSDLRMPGLKNKDMVCQPWRLGLALQADGWWLRRDVIWHKRNPMPESCSDRPTTSHEYILLLAKSERYFYDADSVKEPASPDTHARYARGRSDEHKHAQAALVPGSRPQTIAQSFDHMRKKVAGWAEGPGTHSAIDHAREPRDDGAYADGKSERMGRGPGWRKSNGVGFGYATDAAERGRGRIKNNESFDAAMADMPAMRNSRSVWMLATEPFKGAHFATFPTELPRRAILAGCPAGGVVLDPFNGSGTTGRVALELGRQYVGIELKAEYLELTRRRLHGAQQGLALGAAA